HQVSLGGAAFLTPARTHRASLLLSWDFNEKKRDIDITRGNMFQIQGGAGLPIFGAVGVGLAGYALWQVSADRGDDIPPSLRGLRTRVYGLGPELNVLIRALGLRADFRFEWDFGAEARPEGTVFVAGLTKLAWAPQARPASDGNRE
ncbi:MAG: transporter, partial [Longimicrobiales bacterium]